MVVAHRPPIVFVQALPDDSKSIRNTLPKESDDKNHVLLWNTRLQIPVDTMGQNNLFDCIGNPISMDETDAASTEPTEQEPRQRAVFAPIPQVKDIALINVPMLTGTTMIDALSPLGRGQNMLWVGHNVTDMRTYVMDCLAQQLQPPQTEEEDSQPPIQCIYAALDESLQVQELLQTVDIRDKVRVVVPNMNPDNNGDDTDNEKDDEMSRAAKAVLTAATSCAMAESLALEEGAHTIVVIDTLDWHKRLWDGTTRVLVQEFGIDAVVKGDREGGASSEMRAFFATLIQRAAQFNAARGGGSLTLVLLTQIPELDMASESDNEGEDTDAVFQESDFENSSPAIQERIKVLTQRKIPLTTDNLRKINIPIPSAVEGKRRLILQHVDDLISMSDGQLWFDERLEKVPTSAVLGQGVGRRQCPPLDPQRSFTRVGIGADTESRADAPALRRCNLEGLRLILSQAAAMDGAEVTSATRKQVQKQQALLLAMHQVAGGGGRSLAESCAVLLAAAEGFLNEDLDSVGTLEEQQHDMVSGLLQHLKTTNSDVMSQINQSLDMTTEQKENLINSIQEYVKVNDC